MGRYGNFEWDDGKDAINRDKHGLSLIIAAALFTDPHHLEVPSSGRHASEQRLVAIGSVRGRLLTCVYVWRGPVRRIISLRNASRKERRAYEETNKG
jgi:uncharacterized DUF497 family protein